MKHILITEKLVKYIGFALCIVATIMSTMISQLVDSENILAISSALFLTGSTCILVSKRLKMRAINVQASPPIENSVLYLRAFKDDASIFKFIKSGGTGGSFLNPCTEEEQLMQVLACVGPPIAVGRPSEWLPPTGAQRIYLEDQVWQEKVATMMDAASLIVLQVGEGDGLRWELETILSKTNKNKLLLYCNKLKKAQYCQLVDTIEELSEAALPPFKEVKKRGRVNGFLMLQDDKKMSFLPRKAPFFRKGNSMKPKVEFHYALEHVLPKFGAKWKPYPISLYATSIVAIPACIGLIVTWRLLIT